MTGPSSGSRCRPPASGSTAPAACVILARPGPSRRTSSPFGAASESIWERTVIAWLILSAIFLLISVQFVTPTRRWRLVRRPAAGSGGRAMSHPGVDRRGVFAGLPPAPRRSSRSTRDPRSTARWIPRSPELRGGLVPSVGACGSDASSAGPGSRWPSSSSPNWSCGRSPASSRSSGRRSIGVAIPVVGTARLARRRHPRPTEPRRDGAGGRRRGAPRRPGVERAGAGGRLPGIRRPGRGARRRRGAGPARRGGRDGPLRPPPAARRPRRRCAPLPASLFAPRFSRRPAAAALVAALLLVPVLVHPEPAGRGHRPATVDPRGRRATGRQAGSRRRGSRGEGQGRRTIRGRGSPRNCATWPASSASDPTDLDVTLAQARRDRSRRPCPGRPGQRAAGGVAHVAEPRPVERRDRQAGRQPRRRSGEGQGRPQGPRPRSSTA